jgi:hypothetical protein
MDIVRCCCCCLLVLTRLRCSSESAAWRWHWLDDDGRVLMFFWLVDLPSLTPPDHAIYDVLLKFASVAFSLHASAPAKPSEGSRRVGDVRAGRRTACALAPRGSLMSGALARRGRPATVTRTIYAYAHTAAGAGEARPHG